MKPLHPAQLSVLRVRALITALVLLVPLVPAAVRLGMEIGGIAYAFLAAIAAAVLTAAILLPRRRYASWGYEVAGDELHIAHGIWTRTWTIVPFGRVQHIDVSQGPIERRYGIGTLILHTAGTRNSAVGLPGLALEEAERLRDEIRARIRQDFE